MEKMTTVYAHIEARARKTSFCLYFQNFLALYIYHRQRQRYVIKLKKLICGRSLNLNSSDGRYQRPMRDIYI